MGQYSEHQILPCPTLKSTITHCAGVRGLHCPVGLSPHPGVFALPALQWEGTAQGSPALPGCESEGTFHPTPASSEVPWLGDLA